VNAGRELDALVAEKVMGLDISVRPKHEWKGDADGSRDIFAYEEGDYHNGPCCVRCHFGFCHHCNPAGYDTPCAPSETVAAYSTDIAAAWTVVEKMGLSVVRSEDGWYAIKPEDIEHSTVRGTAYPTLTLVGREFAYNTAYETAPLAICRAALAAVGVEVPA
jgi:hypothetical protein